MNKLIVLCLFLVLAGSAQTDEKRFSVPLNDSPVAGPSDAPITIIEFLDFQ
jgi:hypothetical protein